MALVEGPASGRWYLAASRGRGSFEGWSAGRPEPAAEREGLRYALRQDPASDPRGLGLSYRAPLRADGRITRELPVGTWWLSIERDGAAPLVEALPVAWPPVGGELAIDLP